MDIKFENEDGYFTVTKFFPREGDDERRSYDGKNGGKVVMPSSFEELMALVKQTGQVLNPEGFEKMQKASAKFKSFEDVAKSLKAITDKCIGTETKLKLVGRNRDGKVVAEIPRIVAINKQGESFIADNYIGNKLYFSDYEETQRTKYLNAKPTEMKASEDPLAKSETAEIDSSNEEFSLDSLL